MFLFEFRDIWNSISYRKVEENLHEEIIIIFSPRASMFLNWQAKNLPGYLQNTRRSVFFKPFCSVWLNLKTRRQASLNSLAQHIVLRKLEQHFPYLFRIFLFLFVTRCDKNISVLWITLEKVGRNFCVTNHIAKSLSDSHLSVWTDTHK